MGSIAAEWIREGLEFGKVRGRVEGKAQGGAEGQAEGRAQGQAEGNTKMLCLAIDSVRYRRRLRQILKHVLKPTPTYVVSP